jgi:hypothetical protein
MPIAGRFSHGATYAGLHAMRGPDLNSRLVGDVRPIRSNVAQAIEKHFHAQWLASWAD